MDSPKRVPGTLSTPSSRFASVFHPKLRGVLKISDGLVCASWSNSSQCHKPFPLPEGALPGPFIKHPNNLPDPALHLRSDTHNCCPPLSYPSSTFYLCFFSPPCSLLLILLLTHLLHRLLKTQLSSRLNLLQLPSRLKSIDPVWYE